MTFESMLTTNGALLTPEVVEQLMPYGLRGAKVTLDGDRAAHDAKRQFKNGAGSFDRIIANIRAIGGRIPIQVGGNFDEENVGHIPALLDYLVDKKEAS